MKNGNGHEPPPPEAGAGGVYIKSATVYPPRGEPIEFEGKDVIAYQGEGLIVKVKGGDRQRYYSRVPFVVEYEPSSLATPSSSIIVPG